jgi:hypothetical protein
MILDTHNQWHFVKLVLEDPPKKNSKKGTYDHQGY